MKPIGIRPLSVAAIALGSTLGFGAAAAGGAPTNAPTSLQGNFFDCTNGDSGTFVINSGNNHAPQTWNVAHLMLSWGGTGIFVPTALDLSFNGSPESLVTKGSIQGSVTCMIAASGSGFTLNGTVTGNVVSNG